MILMGLSSLRYSESNFLESKGLVFENNSEVHIVKSMCLPCLFRPNKVGEAIYLYIHIVIKVEGILLFGKV